MAAGSSSPDPQRPAALERGWRGLLLLLLAPLLAGAQAVPSIEYQVKAVYLFNFATFVEWPPAAGAVPDEPFTIGVLGEDPFGPLLDEVVANERIGNRPLVVRRFADPGAIEPCQILFVSRSEAHRLPEVLARVHGHPTLTVADIPGFAASGGMIGFTTEDGSVRFEINRGAVEAAHLSANSKLLRLARIVRTRPAS